MLAGWANAKSSLAQAEHSARLAETELISAQSSLSAEATELREAQEEQDRPKPKPKSRFAESQLGKWSAQAGGYTGSQPSRVESAQAKVDKAQRTVDKAQRNVERADRQVGSSRATVDQWLVAVGVVAAVSVLALVALWGPAVSGPGNPGRGEASVPFEAGGKSTGRPEPDSGSKPTRWQFAAATLLALGVTSTVAQLVALQAFASHVPLAPGENGWSTGGLVALVGTIYMATKCETWDDFKQRIGVLVVVVAALGFAAVYLMVSTQQ